MNKMVIINIGRMSVGFIANINSIEFKNLYYFGRNSKGEAIKMDITGLTEWHEKSKAYTLHFAAWRYLSQLNYYGGYDLPTTEEEALTAFIDPLHLVDMMRFLVQKVIDPQFEYAEELEVAYCII